MKKVKFILCCLLCAVFMVSCLQVPDLEKESSNEIGSEKLPGQTNDVVNNTETSENGTLSEIEYVNYEMKFLTGIENEYFNVSSFEDNLDNSTIEEVKNAQLETIKVGNTEAVATLTTRVFQNGKCFNSVYVSQDKNIEYTLNEKSFRVKSLGDFVLSEYTDSEVNEEKLKSHVQSYLSEYLDGSPYLNYSYSCSTSIVVTNDFSSWRETKDAFYFPQNENETAVRYNIEYYLTCNGIPTTDKITVMCDGDGNIISIYNNLSGIKWSEIKFDSADLLKKASDFIADNIKDVYTVSDCNVDSNTISYDNGLLQLVVVYNAKLKSNDIEISTLCPIIITLSKADNINK